VAELVLLFCLPACSDNSGATVQTSTTTTLPLPATVDIAERAADADAGNPQEASLPAIASTTAAGEYLSRHPELTSLNQIADGLATTAEVTAETCADVADALDALESPAELQTTAAGVPDDALAGLFVGLIAALSNVLASCGDSGADAAALADLAYQSVILDRVVDGL
jgi:hypothetical protein